MSKISKLQILLADDHQMLREGLRALVNLQSDMEVVGEANNGRIAVAMAHQLQPDVVVMDVSMPEMNGLKATERLKKLSPQIRVLVVTRHADSGFIQQLTRAGASGYLLKQSASSELIHAIRAVASGDEYLDPAVTGRVMSAYAARNQPPVRTGREALQSQPELSAREEEVLELVAWGYSNKEVSQRLQLSVKTIEAHKANSSRKLGLNSRTDIVRYALLRGWLKDD
ncbi:MAG TPA: response regulator transcription factor [Blastocatellia bacterium]